MIDSNVSPSEPVWQRLVPAADGHYHPSSEAQLVALVKLAARERRALRVRGSRHSLPEAIATGSGGIEVALDRYGDVRFDDARMQVTVEAGCHIGVDPRDPTGMSTFDRSLVARLDRRGWALSDMGGVSHQTISGYLATGSAGGTVLHSLERSILAVRWVDGRGHIHEARRGQDSRFDAIICSLGLLGVISTITLQCGPRYDLVGLETVAPEASTSYAFYGDGEPGLEGFLRRTDYARLLWFPQRGVRRVVTWQARAMAAGDYNHETGPAHALKPKPYCVIGDVSPNQGITNAASAVAQTVSGAFYDGLSLVSHASHKLVTAVPALGPGLRRARRVLEDKLLAPGLAASLQSGEAQPQRFWGSWHEVLPMDNQMSERSLPTAFTEIFVPLERTGEVMRALRSHFDAHGYDATGAYIFELYAARASRFWLHPAYDCDSLRVDVFWFARNRSDPRAFFQQFWDLLEPFGARLHWAKYLPLDASHLRARLPRWDDFMALRRELDPTDMFLSPYWQRTLGIER